MLAEPAGRCSPTTEEGLRPANCQKPHDQDDRSNGTDSREEPDDSASATLVAVSRLISMPSDRARATNLCVIPEGIWQLRRFAARTESP